MDEKVIQLRVGVIVLCALLILVILIFLFGEGWTPQYTVYLKPATAPGVTKNTPVRKNGILIGRVHHVQTLDTGVLLTLRIRSGERLYANEVCKIGTATFLGDAVIDILPGDKPDRGELIQPGDLFTNVTVERDPLEIINVVMNLEGQIGEALDAVRRAGDTVDEAGQGVRRITDIVQAAVGDEHLDIGEIARNLRNMSLKAEQALDNFNYVMGSVNEVIGDAQVKHSLKMSITDAPRLLDDMRLAVADAREAFASFQELSGLAETNLRNLESFTLSLGTDGPEMIERLKQSSFNLDELLMQVNAFATALNEGEGTIGRLVRDPQMYDDLQNTLANAREISERLRPVVNDLRVFADAVARDPGQLGVRGALDRRPTGSGYKPTIMR